MGNTTSPQEFLAAVRAAREEGPIRGRVYVACEQPACPLSAIDLKVWESAMTKPLQPPLRCPRCSHEWHFYGYYGSEFHRSNVLGLSGFKRRMQDRFSTLFSADTSKGNP